MKNIVPNVVQLLTSKLKFVQNVGLDSLTLKTKIQVIKMITIVGNYKDADGNPIKYR